MDKIQGWEKHDEAIVQIPFQKTRRRNFDLVLYKDQQELQDIIGRR